MVRTFIPMLLAFIFSPLLVFFALCSQEVIAHSCFRASTKFVSTGRYKAGSLCWNVRSFKAGFESDGNLLIRDGLHNGIFYTTLPGGSTNSFNIYPNGNITIEDAEGMPLWTTNTGSYNQQVGFGFTIYYEFIVVIGCSEGEPGCIKINPPLFRKYWGYKKVWQSCQLPPCTALHG